MHIINKNLHTFSRIVSF